jgi:hypothetical protein
MKKTTLESLAENPQAVMEEAQRERILVTRDGKPMALVVGLENYDEEDWSYMSSRAFWEMIRASRDGATVRLDAVKAELLQEDA